MVYDDCGQDVMAFRFLVLVAVRGENCLERGSGRAALWETWVSFLGLAGLGVGLWSVSRGGSNEGVREVSGA